MAASAPEAAVLISQPISCLITSANRPAPGLRKGVLYRVVILTVGWRQRLLAPEADGEGAGEARGGRPIFGEGVQNEVLRCYI